MKISLFANIKNAWATFRGRDPTYIYTDLGYGSGYRADRTIHRRNEKTMLSSIYTRISMDCASIDVRHVVVDSDGLYKSDANSDLDYCLSVEANCDQTGKTFIQDVAMSLLDEGVIAVVPTDTERDDITEDITSIYTMRVARITEWFPKHVKVNVYNEQTGQYEELIVEKAKTAIIESPLYSVLNEPNSTLKRLVRKLQILDVVDEQSGSGKLDIIVHLPFMTGTEAKKNKALIRKREIESDLANSKYGIAFADVNERITQLNRPAENNLMKQIEYLTSMLYSQLGITTSVLDGTADEATLLNYYNRVIEPLMSAIIDELKRKFISRSARQSGETIMFFRDPFKLIPISMFASIADKLSRNEVMTANELRPKIGLRPSDDPSANELRNKNLNKPQTQTKEEFIQNGKN